MKNNLLDRKKLEPIRNQFGVLQNSNDNELDKNQYIEDEQSISENTVSSDKQQLNNNNLRVPKKVCFFFNLLILIFKIFFFAEFSTPAAKLYW